MKITKLKNDVREYIWGSENWLFGANTDAFSNEELGTNALDFPFSP